MIEIPPAAPQAAPQPQPIGQVVITVFDNNTVNVQTNLEKLSAFRTVGLGTMALADMFRKQEETSVQPVPMSAMPGKLILAN